MFQLSGFYCKALNGRGFVKGPSREVRMRPLKGAGAEIP